MKRYPPELSLWFGAEPVENGTVTIAGRDYTITERWGGQGARLWPCSVTLARTLVADVHYWAGKSVCELGAGIGLPSMALAAHGANVTAVDAERSIADWLRMTMFANRLHASVFTSNWAEWHLGPFDSVIASDVVYPAYGIAALAACLARTWNGRGLCVIANGRADHADDFRDALAAHGMMLDVRSLESEHRDGRRMAVTLFDISRG